MTTSCQSFRTTNAIFIDECVVESTVHVGGEHSIVNLLKCLMMNQTQGYERSMVWDWRSIPLNFGNEVRETQKYWVETAKLRAMIHGAWVEVATGESQPVDAIWSVPAIASRSWLRGMQMGLTLHMKLWGFEGTVNHHPQGLRRETKANRMQ